MADAVSPSATDFFAGPPAQKPKVHKTMLDAEDFTALFLAQLKHQDPLNPTDAQDMILQTAAIASVQQGHKQIDHLAALREDRESSGLAQAAGLIGRKAALTTRHVDHQGDGAQVAYQLDGDAHEVTVQILDGQGALVRTLSASEARPKGLPPDTSPAPWRGGSQHIGWNGRDQNGNEVAPGRYQVVVNAVDREQGAVPARTQLVGQVERVDTQQGRPRLVVGGRTFSLGEVEAILAD